MIRVLVKAASSIVQAELEPWIASESSFRLVHEEREGRGQRELTDEESPDVIIAQPGEADEDAVLTDWGESYAALVLLGGDLSPVGIADALHAGARGILPARVSREELLATVHAAAAGLIVLHAENVSAVVAGRSPIERRSIALIEPLTPRENEVLTMLAEGATNKEIAARLSISDHTVKFHVSSIISKLGATSRTEAVTLAIKQGLIMV